MADAMLSENAQGRLIITGDLSFATVPKLWLDWQRMATGHSTLEIDLGGVERSDSAGLALLIEGLRRARQTGQKIGFFNIPAQMQAIARVSGLTEMLSLPEDT